MFLLKL